ncbi:MAG TPA: helix-turn-helix transcriptional regulator [Actinospica sp.]|nr:helix-turn-helix transcriptional regulator [Actinospica sp.]
MTTRPLPRTPNLALRRARQSMRLSQAQFADAVRAAGNAMGAPNHCTKRLVQKWETGEHAACRPDYLRVLQAVTGLSARELGFRILPDESGLSAAVADAAPAPADAPAPGAGFAMAGLTEYTANGSIENSMDRLRHALDHPSTVDSRTAELVEASTSRLFDLQHHSPARLLAPTADRHISTITALLGAARHEAVRRRLMLNAGRSALLAGWLAFDRGDTASAHRYWDTSIGAAESTVDSALLAASLTCLGYSAARRGDPGTAWQLSHTAGRHTPDDRRATAWAVSRAALHAAELGEIDAARTAMERSMALADGLPGPRPDDGGMPWTRFFDRARLLSSTAHTAALIHDPDAPDYAAQAVEALSPAKVKTRAVVLAECALVAALSGELELCLDYGASAAPLTREMDVSLASDLLYAVVPVVLPYSDTRAVRELLPQLTRLTRAIDREELDRIEAPISAPGAQGDADDVDGMDGLEDED